MVYKVVANIFLCHFVDNFVTKPETLAQKDFLDENNSTTWILAVSFVGQLVSPCWQQHHVVSAGGTRFMVG
jgi:hypothetical protein